MGIKDTFVKFARKRSKTLETVAKKISTLHNKNVHEGQNAHKCEMCGKIFRSKANLEVHVNSLHNGIKYKCQLCDMPFMQLRTLNKRVKLIHGIHEGLKFKCEACNDSFKSKSHLLRHVKIIHEKQRQKCEICDKTFS